METFRIILILCLVVVPIYYKTIRFDGFWGILMFTLGLVALFMRLSLISLYPIIGFINTNTIFPSLLLIFTPALIFVFFGTSSSHFKSRLKRLKRLILPYEFFGGLQQIFFFVVFSDAFFYTTRNLNITFAVTVLFFVGFHLSWLRRSMRKYLPLLILFAIINTWIYLIWGNLLPQILVHGLVGSILFTDFTDTDQLRIRTGRG